jgi:hypothetical protein
VLPWTEKRISIILHSQVAFRFRLARREILDIERICCQSIVKALPLLLIHSAVCFRLEFTHVVEVVTFSAGGSESRESRLVKLQSASEGSFGRSRLTRAYNVPATYRKIEYLTIRLKCDFSGRILV